MSLQIVLLLLGVLIVASVAYTSMDHGKRGQRHKRRFANSEDLDEPEIDTVQLEHEYDPAADAEPAPWVAAPLQGKKALKSDTPVPTTLEPPAEQKARSTRRQLEDELDQLEQVSQTRLDVDPDIDIRNQPEKEGESLQRANQPMAPDERIDFIVTLPGRSRPIPRDKALGIYKQNEYMLDKPRGLYGLRNVTKVWSNLDSDPISTEYTDLRLAIQLADINGPVTESELNTFTQLSLKLADPLKRRTLFSMEHDEALQMARKLDAFCKEFDVVASFNILANGPVGFMGLDISSAMSQLDMHLGPRKVFNKYPGHNQRAFPCYSLANLYDPGTFEASSMQRFVTKGLTLFMQIPCVRNPAKVFEQMAKDAMKLCNTLDGKLLDQDNKPLTQNGLKLIYRQVKDIDARMTEQGITAGSETAIRLFDV